LILVATLKRTAGGGSASAIALSNFKKIAYIELALISKFITADEVGILRKGAVFRFSA
jgi:hypothetical protein